MKRIRPALLCVFILLSAPARVLPHCDTMNGPVVKAAQHKVRAAAEVPVLPNNDKPEIPEATRRAVIRAGYNLDDFAAEA
ncbi:MAG TPA: hypothetical protein VL633_11125 [Bacteroidota bacterium]|jgi:hypothetical protein|nr:hypothetical protein [Bacteroidota bacterium]